MRIVISVLLVLFSSLVNASCEGTRAHIETKDYKLIISNDACDPDPREFILVLVKDANGRFIKQGEKVPFLSECSITKMGFKCRPDGETPLAGATYKLTNFGRSGNSCATPEELGAKYICIAGCSSRDTPFENPEYLIGPEGSC